MSSLKKVVFLAVLAAIVVVKINNDQFDREVERVKNNIGCDGANHLGVVFAPRLSTRRNTLFLAAGPRLVWEEVPEETTRADRPNGGSSVEFPERLLRLCSGGIKYK